MSLQKQLKHAVMIVVTNGRAMLRERLNTTKTIYQHMTLFTTNHVVSIFEQIEKYLASTPDAKKGNSGRPENPILRDAFLYTCTDFETHEEEQLSVHQLVDIMNDKLSHTELSSYNHRYMKKKLLEHYGDNITITEDNGRKNIATYNPKVSSYLGYYCKPKDVNVELEKIQLIEAAAAILQSEIKEKVSTTKDFYPPPEELSREDCLHYLPPLLRLLLTKMFSGIEAELKTATIDQCIIQAVRPRSIMAPLQIGLAVQMCQHFRSRYLLDTLHRMGLSSSYKEAMRFERNAAVICGSQLDGQVGEDSFIKFSADNVDHNLDSKNSKQQKQRTSKAVRYFYH